VEVDGPVRRVDAEQRLFSVEENEEGKDAAQNGGEAQKQLELVEADPEGADGDYEVLAWARPDRLEVAVRDFGRGMNPRMPSESAGLGLGLPLMLAIGDEVSFRSHEDGATTEVRLTFSPEMVPDAC